MALYYFQTQRHVINWNNKATSVMSVLTMRHILFLFVLFSCFVFRDGRNSTESIVWFDPHRCHIVSIKHVWSKDIYYIVQKNFIIWTLMPENLTFLHASNKGADQYAHLRSLISTFVIAI